MRWNPAQQKAIDARGTDICVAASAGSGKTTVLIERLLGILEKDGVDLSQIVAITFTDAAAAEMRERLRAKFREREVGAPRDVLSFWRDLSRRVESARISTIHTFCGGLLRENAPAMGLDPDFGVLVEAEAMLLRDEALRACLYDLLEQGDESAMHCVEQLGATEVLRLSEGLLDKRDLVASIRAATPSDPEQMVAHWRKVTESIRDEMLTDPELRAEAAEFARQLDAFEGLMIGQKDGREQMRRDMLVALEAIRQADDPRIVAEAVEAIAGLKVGNTRADRWPEGVHGHLKTLQETVKEWAQGLHVPWKADEVLMPSAALSLHLHRLALRVIEAYQRAKSARNVVDFSDMIDYALTMLRESPDLRRRVAGGIRHLLVDEFQDTDPLQYEMVTLLRDANPEMGLFLVGDAKQSIYAFRGANVALFQEAERRCRQIRLDMNYRSRPEVVAFVNAVCSEAPLLRAVEEAYTPMQAHRTPSGVCSVDALVVPTPDGTAARRDELQEREAELIAHRIAELCSGDEGFRFGDVAMLFRSSRAMYLYEHALRDCGVPYQVIAGDGYYDRQEVVDVTNLLRVVLDPCDEPALVGFLRGPACCLTDDDLVLLAAAGGVARVFESTETPDGLRDGPALDEARALIAELRACSHAPLSQFVRQAIDRSRLEAIALTQHLGLQRASNVRKVGELAEEFSRTSAPRLRPFVRYLLKIGARRIREGEAALQSESSDAVTLMTVHKSKGLEFPVVVVADVGRNYGRQQPEAVLVDPLAGIVVRAKDDLGKPLDLPVFGLVRRRHRLLGNHEEERLLYVAMTRARDRLVLAGAGSKPDTTWLNAVDKAFGVLGAKDDDVIERFGVKLRVRTVATAHEGPGVGFAEGADADRELLAKRIRPIAAPRARRGRMTVSALAKQMAEADGPYESLGSTTRTPTTPPVPVAPPAVDALLRGTLLHRVLEAWDYRGCVEPVVDRVLRRDAPSLAIREAMASYLRDRATAFAATPVGRRLATGEVASRELPFLLRLGDTLVDGAIDLLLADGTVVDYKTGRDRPESHAQYERQVQIYAMAARTLTGWDAPGAFLCYVDTAEIVEVDISPAALEETSRRALEAVEVLSAYVA